MYIYTLNDFYAALQILTHTHTHTPLLHPFSLSQLIPRLCIRSGSNSESELEEEQEPDDVDWTDCLRETQLFTLHDVMQLISFPSRHNRRPCYKSWESLACLTTDLDKVSSSEWESESVRFFAMGLSRLIFPHWLFTFILFFSGSVEGRAAGVEEIREETAMELPSLHTFKLKMQINVITMFK